MSLGIGDADSFPPNEDRVVRENPFNLVGFSTKFLSDRDELILPIFIGQEREEVGLPDNSRIEETQGQQEVVTHDHLIPAVRENPKTGKKGLWSKATWEGVVEEVKRDRFSARMTEVQFGKPTRNEIEETEFMLDELQYASDRDLVQPGAVFYWTVGRASNAAGSISNASVIRFRRMPTISGLTKLRADKEAEDLYQDLGFAES
jgi:hypothetical protein